MRVDGYFLLAYLDRSSQEHAVQSAYRSQLYRHTDLATVPYHRRQLLWQGLLKGADLFIIDPVGAGASAYGSDDRMIPPIAINLKTIYTFFTSE